MNLTITGLVTRIVPRGSINEIKDFDQGFLNQLSAGVNIGADFVRGNNRVASINAGANLGWANNKTEATFKVNTILNEQTDAPDTRRFTSSLGIDHSLGGRPRAGVSLSYESDENQQLDYRTVSTVSVGYRIIQEQRTRLDLSVGSGPTAEKFTGSESEVIGEGRTGFSLIARPNGDTKVDLSAFLFPSLFDFDRLRVEADLTFAVEIIADLDFNVSSFYRFNSEPPVDVDKNDYGVNFGIAWSY